MSNKTVETNGVGTETIKQHKRRGRKTTRIFDAFKAITSQKLPAEEFARQHQVSLNVLRQAKRFDAEEDVQERGPVRVRKVHVNENGEVVNKKGPTTKKVLMIWRDVNNTQSE